MAGYFLLSFFQVYGALHEVIDRDHPWSAGLPESEDELHAGCRRSDLPRKSLVVKILRGCGNDVGARFRLLCENADL